MINLNKIAQNAFKAVQKREEEYVDNGVIVVLKRCAGAVIEAADEYSSLDSYDVYGERISADGRFFEAKLVNIIMCVIHIASIENINIEDALYRYVRENKIGTEEVR